MKKSRIKLKRVVGLLLVSLIVFSCSDFEEINIDPKAAGVEQIQVEYFINASMNGAQLNPHVAERAFELYWGSAGRMSKSSGLMTGNDNDSWSTDYFNAAARWQTDINTAISVAEQKIENNQAKEYTNNLMQVARIWRVYLMSEMTDTFGPITIDGFKGVNPIYSSVKDVYYFLLEELKDATSKIDESIVIDPITLSKFDPSTYGYDFTKWRKYGNSLRMRLAMRLSEVDEAKAKQEFEEAVNGEIIASNEDNFKVFENEGWNDLSGVMSRPWWFHQITPTLNNLMIGLGGITTEEQFAGKPEYHTGAFEINNSIKDEDYLGIRYTDHLPTKTNSPASEYWLDGLVNKIDPRAYKAYTIPNDPADNGRIFLKTLTGSPLQFHDLLKTDGSGDILETLDTSVTWNSFPDGDWGTKGNFNANLVWHPGALPCLDKKFRITDGSVARIFFAAWESHFLIAEAAVRGWNVPMSGKAAYEEGIAQNFDYWATTENLGAYLASDNYNRLGTSVSWDHTIEPPASYTMNYVDGYDNTMGTVNIKYPENTIYEGGAVKNDLLTKIITQKYIAQTPWLPLEAWSDHRRLGLPFFENPVVEQSLPNTPDLNDGNFQTNSPRFFPQRIRYYSDFSANNPLNYSDAVNLLEGPDEVLTPLWWAKK